MVQRFRGLPRLHKAGKIRLPIEPQTKSEWGGTRVKVGAVSDSEAMATRSKHFHHEE